MKEFLRRLAGDRCISLRYLERKEFLARLAGYLRLDEPGIPSMDGKFS